MKLLLFLLLLLISPGVSAAPLPDIFPALPAPAPPHLFPHQPGDLARDRLGKMAPVLLTASKVCPVNSGLPQPALPPTHAKAVIAALSDLVFDDSLYVSDAHYEMQDKGSRVTLVVGDFGKEVIVTLWRDKALMTIHSEAAHGWVAANYLPVLPKVVNLLRATDPDAPGLNMTLVKAPPPQPSTKGVPASVLTRIATLEPGMTRADVMRLFTTEGGVFTTYWNHYVYRSVVPVAREPNAPLMVPGGLVKVNVDFAPPDADTVWLDGRGFWLGRNKYPASRNQFDLSGNPNDIVLQVSPPYVQQMILD